jgi:16S rRNA (guanine(966)-N(2))-methyltransferase RsmD
MRIISGKYKSRRINAPKNLPVRPTTDMAKEALFNILNNNYYFDQIIVLDLFAGIGSISFEFASRGTTKITSIDKNQGCVQFLDKIIDELEFDIQTINSDVYLYLERVNHKFDVIFADPPYDFEISAYQKIVDLIFEKDMLNEDGMLIIEHGKKTDLSGYSNFKNARKYGGNMFSFFNL